MEDLDEVIKKIIKENLEISIENEEFDEFHKVKVSLSMNGKVFSDSYEFINK